MIKEKTHLTLVYRKKSDAAQSIERLFGNLEPYLHEEFILHRLVVPHSSSNLLSLVCNVLFVIKNAKGIVHVTGDVNYILPFLNKANSILTIHDGGNLMNFRGIKQWVYNWIWFKFPCRSAARVVVTSEATRLVLEKLVGSFGSKVRVIDACVSFGFRRIPRAFNSLCPRILQIGSGLHKNLDSLIKAVDGLKCELMIVGNPSSEDRLSLEKKHIRYRIETNVTDDRIRSIYGECDILFFASRHEGFGLPILEAQASGIAVITSNCYSMPYVAGQGGAVIVDPESVGQIRQAIELISQDVSARSELIAKGSENIKRFSAERFYQKHSDVYQNLIS